MVVHCLEFIPVVAQLHSMQFFKDNFVFVVADIGCLRLDDPLGIELVQFEGGVHLDLGVGERVLALELVVFIIFEEDLDDPVAINSVVGELIELVLVLLEFGGGVVGLVGGDGGLGGHGDLHLEVHQLADLWRTFSLHLKDLYIIPPHLYLMDAPSPNQTLLPASLATRIAAYDANAPAAWSCLRFQPNGSPAILLDISTPNQTASATPVCLTDSCQFSQTVLQVSKQNKQQLLQSFSVVPCHQINQTIKDYFIVNVEIEGVVGIQYQVVGYQWGPKVAGSRGFDQLFQQQRALVGSIWSDYKSKYCRSLADKKNPLESNLGVLPFLQCQTSVILAPLDSNPVGFGERQLFKRRIPIVFCLSEEVASLQDKIDKIVKEALLEGQSKVQASPYPVMGGLRCTPNKIFNPHLYAQPAPKKDFEIISVKGSYEYYHYGDQNFSDNGWGCAYRAFQTLLSWLHIQGHAFPVDEMISIRQIQNKLDTYDRTRKLKGSSEWIGATEISWMVPKMTKRQLNCKILHVSDGKKILEKCQEFKQHFLNSGCPIMYGGGEYAYSIVAMHYNWKLGECEFLILDPHYTGEDDYGKILEKKGLAWRKPEEMFKKGVFYNFCLPIIS